MAVCAAQSNRGVHAILQAAAVTSVQGGKDVSPERGGKAHALSPKKSVHTKVASPQKVDPPPWGFFPAHKTHTLTFMF